ncbi:MAG: pantetheine-phosphate adenylyltransferase [Candidatus Zixiibacteriota bacterium]
MTASRPQRLGIYAGTFDPITFGHLDLIHRALALFDNLIVAIAQNPTKQPLFTADERHDLILECLKTFDDPDLEQRIEVLIFDGLLADLARRRKATAFLRGLRAVSDFEFEFQMALTNRSLAPEVEAVYLMPNAKYSFLSSSIIKDVARHGGDVSKFVPPVVVQRMARRFGK